MTLTAQRVVMWLIAGQYTIVSVYYLTIRLGWNLVTPKTALELLKCLGMYHVTYISEDTSTDMCDGSAFWTLRGLACRVFVGILYTMSSNLLEIYLLWKSISIIKSKTKDVKQLLSLSAYQQRQR